MEFHILLKFYLHFFRFTTKVNFYDCIRTEYLKFFPCVVFNFDTKFNVLLYHFLKYIHCTQVVGLLPSRMLSMMLGAQLEYSAIAQSWKIMINWTTNELKLNSVDWFETPLFAICMIYYPMYDVSLRLICRSIMHINIYIDRYIDVEYAYSANVRYTLHNRH